MGELSGGSFFSARLTVLTAVFFLKNAAALLCYGVWNGGGRAPLRAVVEDPR